ncbi:gamma-glutamyl-gamma-aminobutyrate hydrolase family protein [Ornithinimicrobium sp. LYQ103]|uniref:gamma-glutamyl-gamma-aminobutyrate hydrolase family protein n=1 Tax=Ornithinimicrobium sp. LYQ103 TaxID=3378796 RepID=UPI0038519C16
MRRVAIPERSTGHYGPIPPRITKLIEELEMRIVPIPVGARAAVYDFDALLLTGGTDPNPRLTGTTVDVLGDDQAFDDERDQRELAAVAVALSRGRPVLGLCRGAELLTISFGGSLRALEPAGRAQHGARLSQQARAPAFHDVLLYPDSELARQLRTDVIPDCSSSHSLTPIVPLGSDLQVAARAPDGMVEAIEVPARRVLGVMWHPEDSPDSTVQKDLVRIALSSDRSDPT